MRVKTSEVVCVLGDVSLIMMSCQCACASQRARPAHRSHSDAVVKSVISNTSDSGCKREKRVRASRGDVEPET